MGKVNSMIVKGKRKKKTVLNVMNMNEDCHMMEDKRNSQNVYITANIVYIGSLK
jgi:hypothetical protein